MQFFSGDSSNFRPQTSEPLCLYQWATGSWGLDYAEKSCMNFFNYFFKFPHSQSPPTSVVVENAATLFHCKAPEILCRLWNFTRLPIGHTLHNAMCVPCLLDGLHPFVALTLFLGPQLQRLLSIVTKHNQEVVLKNKERKAVYVCDPEPLNTLTTPCRTCHIIARDVSVAPVLCWPPLIGHMAQTYGNIALSCICFFNALFLPGFVLYNISQT